MKKFILLLLIILLLGLGLRVYKLDTRPIGFTWDEAALGYNAYSLSKIGKDEYGQIMPAVFKSFGDYKPGSYIYFTVPIIKFFGLNEFTTRFSSAIFGSLLILVVYLFSKNHFAALLLAINPWAIQFSRGAWEANLSLFLTTLAAVLFIKKRFWLSALFFGLTLLTYQGAKMFTPLIMVSLFVIYRPNIKLLIKPLIFLIFLILPILLGFTSQSGRLKVYSVFSYTRNIQSLPFDYKLSIFHAEIIDQARGIIQRYTNYFSPRFLFFAGDWTNFRQSIPYYGYLHIPELLTVIVGLYLLIKTSNQDSKFLGLWLILAPLPAALSRDLVSGVRSLPMIFPLVIISGLGLKKISRHRLLLFFYSFVLIFFFFYYLDQYYTHAPIYGAPDMLYGYRQAWKEVAKQQSNYHKVIFSDKMGQPYIFGLFYLKIDPQKVQKELTLKNSQVGDVGQVISFDKYEFRPIYWPSDRGLSSTLFIGNQYELPEIDLHDIDNLKRISEIHYPDGSSDLRVVGLP